MTNDEALAILAAKRSAANAAINGLNEYRSQGGDWKTDIASLKRTRHGGKYLQKTNRKDKKHTCFGPKRGTPGPNLGETPGPGVHKKHIVSKTHQQNFHHNWTFLRELDF